MSTYVTYYRVSTKSQGQSGLGLSAQQEGVKQLPACGRPDCCQLHRGGVRTQSPAPQLAAALAQCRRRRVIAPHRKARSTKPERGVPCPTCSRATWQSSLPTIPTATKFTVHILAAVAEHEAAMISQRTRAALHAAKARGIALGGNRGRTLSDAERAQGRAVQAAAARERALSLLPVVNEIRATGVTTLAGIASRLTERGIDLPGQRLEANAGLADIGPRGWLTPSHSPPTVVGRGAVWPASADLST